VPKRLDLLGGVLLGVTNFASLYFLLRAFDVQIMERAMVIPLLNLSVIVLATAAGMALLGDRLNNEARWGVALATAAIGLMMIFD
jgi:uncharacterized membrane protein